MCVSSPSFAVLFLVETLLHRPACRATSSTFADSFCLFLPLRLRLKPFLYSLFHPLLCPPFLLPTRSSFLLLRLVYVVLLRPLSISLTLSLSLPSHLFPFSSPLSLQIDFAATWPRRNAITLSVCSLFPFFLSFFYPCPFLLFRLRSPPSICPPRETSRSLIAGMGLCRVRRASNRALSLKPIHIYTRRSTRVSRATRLPRRLSTMLDNAMSVHGNVARRFCYGRYLSRLEYPLSSESFPGFVREKRGVRRFRV